MVEATIAVQWRAGVTEYIFPYVESSILRKTFSGRKVDTGTAFPPL
jgi:hypothetical protein